MFSRRLLRGSLFRRDRRGGVQVVHQAVVPQSFSTVLVKLPSQLVVVVDVIVVAAAVPSAKDSFSCSGVGLQLFMIKTFSRGGGA